MKSLKFEISYTVRFFRDPINQENSRTHKNRCSHLSADKQWDG